MEESEMELNYNVSGERRKELVQIISGVVGMKAVYKFMPTCAYAISNLIVSKDGTLVADERTDLETLRKVVNALERAGFAAESLPEELVDTQPDEAESADTADEEPDSLVVSLPMDGFTESSLDNLRKLVDSKQSLIKKALGTEELLIEVTEDRVSFPWFSGTFDPDTTQAYIQFIVSLCAMAKEAKRVTATEKPTDNEKYAFRCFLLRLGFIGNEYKTYRKILLKNLTGSSAFKAGARKEAATDAVSE
jgi:hypothetical protein